MYDHHDVAGRDFADSERWGGLFSFTARPSDNLKVTLDYYRYRNNATPDWGVPVRNIDNVPVTELRFSRNMWVGMAGLDFFKEDADILTGTIVYKMTDGVTLTDRSKVGESPQLRCHVDGRLTQTCTIPTAIRQRKFMPTRPSEIPIHHRNPPS